MRAPFCVALLVCACATVLADGYEIKDRVVYRGKGSTSRRMTVYLPKGDGEDPRPAVLLLHGGAWLFGTRHQLHWYGKRLAEHGFVAASVSYRMMPRHAFPHCLHDCKAAVRWLRLHARDYNVDPAQIAVLGNSAGGHLASLLATTTPGNALEGAQNPGPSSAVRAAVSLYGVADMSYYRKPKGYIRLGGFTRRYVERFVEGASHSAGDPYDLASPAYHAHRGTAPILFVHGNKDNQVPHAQSVAFHARLRRLGVPTRLITVRHGHAFDFFHHKTRDHVFAEILDFLEVHLKYGHGRIE